MDPHLWDDSRTAAILLGLGALAVVFEFVRRQSTAWHAWFGSWRRQSRRARRAVEEARWAEVNAELKRLQGEIDALRREQAIRDALITRHVQWDHAVIVLAAKHGLADHLPDPPPLFPTAVAVSDTNEEGAPA